MKISVITPVLNEENFIGSTLRHVRDTAVLLPTEIIVVDGQSTDNSLNVAQNLADKVIISDRTGRAHQMHQGALASSGDILLFLHVDTLLPDNWQASLRNAWQSSDKPIATAFQLGFDKEDLFYRIISTMGHWRTLCTRVPQGDQAIALERQVYFSVGGFPDVPLMEEYYLFHKLKPLGSVRILPDKVRTSSRRYVQKGRIFVNLRNVFITILFYLRVPPHLLARLYR